VLGIERVDRETVLNSLTLQTGQPFRRGALLESQRTLYESNLFRLAVISVPDSLPPALRDSVKDVTVFVSESPLRERRLGIGITSVDFVQTQGHYTNYNLLGGARRLDLDITVGNLLARHLAGRGFFVDPATIVPGRDLGEFQQPTWSVSANFRQPAFMRRPRDQAGFSAFAHRRSSPGIYIDRGFGGAATFTRQVRVRAPASLSYRFEINRVEAGDVYFCVNYGVCDISTIETLRAHRSLSPISLSGFVDRSDVPLNPTRGYSARASLEHASGITRSDYAFYRAALDVAAYTHRELNVFSAHLKLGVVRTAGTSSSAEGVLHPRKRFYAGGANSVRGFPENQLGPRILAIDPARLAGGDNANGCARTADEIALCDPNASHLRHSDFLPQPLGGTSVIEASVEWRFPTPLHRKLDGALFIDAGVVGRSALQTLSDLPAIAKGAAAITPGFGVRYRSPVGPIRFDIGINPRLHEELPVVTEVLHDGERRIVTLPLSRRYTLGGPRLLDRLTVHFSIGQAY
jgi:outer membrane protein insertion porin family/translocation and assembly module TamA